LAGFIKPAKTIPMLFEAFLLLSRLNDYGINVSPLELEKMDPKVIRAWQMIMQYIPASEINPKQA
jgi:hypothetical protein